MSRLDKQRQEFLEPKRMEHALFMLKEAGISESEIETTKTFIKFNFKGSTILFYPYSGWHTGKTINDGRGLQKLLKQLK